MTWQLFILSFFPQTALLKSDSALAVCLARKVKTLMFLVKERTQSGLGDVVEKSVCCLSEDLSLVSAPPTSYSSQLPVTPVPEDHTAAGLCRLMLGPHSHRHNVKYRNQEWRCTALMSALRRQREVEL